MSDLIDLSKKVEIVLTKRNLTNVKAQVGVAMDISGSMQELYRNGTVQRTMDRLLAVACKFDDNQTLDAWTFSNGYYAIPPITPDLFSTYVRKHILENGKVSKWGGTDYAPVIQAAIEHYGFQNPSTPTSGGGFFGLFKKVQQPVATPTPYQGKPAPAFLIMVTDGENSDHAEARRVLEAASKHDIYVEFVGIGNSNFRFIEAVADAYPNVGFVAIRDLQAMTDEALYDALVNAEFAEWIKKRV
jgi:hypothetical protein